MDISAIFGAAVALVAAITPIAFAALKIYGRREDARIERERIAANAIIETEKLKAAAIVDAAKFEVEAARYRMEAAKMEEERRARVDENTALLIERLLTALIGAQQRPEAQQVKTDIGGEAAA